MAQKILFNHQNCIENLKLAIVEGDILIDPLVGALDEILVLFSHLGSAIGIAFADIKEKTDVLRKESQNYQLQTLLAIINKEKDLDVIKYSGDNNKKLTKDPILLKYISVTRTQLRLMWFFDFIISLFNQFIADSKKEFTSICKEAYNKALAPNHNFAIRMAAQAGFLAAPYRKEFQYQFCGGVEKSQDEVNQIAKELSDNLQKINDFCWNYYKVNNYTKLE